MHYESAVIQSAKKPPMAGLSGLKPLLGKAGFTPSLSGMYMPPQAIEGVRFVITPDLNAGKISITCWLPSGQRTRTFDLISTEAADLIDHAANYLEEDSVPQSKSLRELRRVILALARPSPQIVGYRVINDMGEQWGDRRGWEVLSEKEAIAELRIARLTSKAFWQIVAILNDEVDRTPLTMAA